MIEEIYSAQTAVLASSWSVLGAFVGKAVLVMTLIALAAVATPYIAKRIDKNKKTDTEKASAENLSQQQGGEVHSPFEKSKDEDFDPNYKIYNTDIYGVEKKHGKK